MCEEVCAVHCMVHRLLVYTPSTIMPADRSTTTSTHYNVHSHDNHRDNDQPYPLPRTVYIQSSTHDPATSFQHLCLSDHIVTTKCVTRHKLEHLETSHYLRGLIAEGAKESWDMDCPFNGVVTNTDFTHQNLSSL
jgi:hypothetical protein